MNTVVMTKGDERVTVNNNPASMRPWSDAGFEIAEGEAATAPPAFSSSSDDPQDPGDTDPAPSGDGDDTSGGSELDAMSYEQLREAIKERTGRYPANLRTEEELREQLAMITQATE